MKKIKDTQADIDKAKEGKDKDKKSNDERWKVWQTLPKKQRIKWLKKPGAEMLRLKFESYLDSKKWFNDIRETEV